MRTTTTDFDNPGLIPLLPGSNLYYSLLAAMTGDSEKVAEKGVATLLGVVGIVVGIVASSILFIYLIGLVTSHRQRRGKPTGDR